MASRSSDLGLAADPVRDSEALPRWVIEPSVQAGIQAARRILGAMGVDLLRVERRTGRVAIAAPLRGDPLPLSSAVLRAVAAPPDRPRVGDRPRWLAGSEPGEATLVGQVAEQSARSFFLVLRMADTARVRERAEALLPDVASLIQLHADAGERLDAARETRDAAMDALDQGECGLIAVRADQTIVLANTAARATLAAEAGLHVRRGMVRPTALADAIRFREALERVIDPPRVDVARPKAIAMLLTGDGAGVAPILVIAPASRAREADGVAATITVHQPSPGPVRGLETLCRLHGLSKVESRLLHHLTAGLTLTEAAGEMRVKVETARAYLKQAFGKTGMHRQTDLVTMMARYARALRGDFDFLAA